MKTPVVTEKRKPFLFGFLMMICFFACFLFAPLGSFMVWIFGGATVYFLFMSVYSMIPSERRRSVGRRLDPRQAETRAYIATHIPILISMFLGGLLFVIVMLLILS